MATQRELNRRKELVCWERRIIRRKPSTEHLRLSLKLGSCLLWILMAKSIFLLGMNVFKTKKSVVFDFATNIPLVTYRLLALTYWAGSLSGWCALCAQQAGSNHPKGTRAIEFWDWHLYLHCMQGLPAQLTFYSHISLKSRGAITSSCSIQPLPQ